MRAAPTKHTDAVALAQSNLDAPFKEAHNMSHCFTGVEPDSLTVKVSAGSFLKPDKV